MELWKWRPVEVFEEICDSAECHTDIPRRMTQRSQSTSPPSWVTRPDLRTLSETLTDQDPVSGIFEVERYDRITDLTLVFRDAQARGENTLRLFRRDGV